MASKGRPSTLFTLFSIVSTILFSPAHAEKLIISDSISSCMTNSLFTVSSFDVLYTPNNATLSYGFDGISTIEGNVTFVLEVIAYGFTAFTKIIDPCQQGFTSLCPMNAGAVQLPPSNIDAKDFAGNIPGIAFTIPDLDGKARIFIKRKDTGLQVACLEAELSNTKTVHQNAVSWTTAIISGLGLFVSAMASGLGYSNTAAHVAANALSLFGYFQGQAMVGMVAVALPPITRSWTQNFAWSMGIIRIGFMQRVLSWYIQATGGTPDLLFNNLQNVNVGLAKRGLEIAPRSDSVLAGVSSLLKRSNADSDYSNGKSIIVTGIRRMSFLARIEESNYFITGIGFLVAFVFFVVIGVLGFKFGSEVAVSKLHIAKGSKFVEFRKGWKIVLKGILYRIVLIAFPQVVILSLWELTNRDSAAAVILAVVFFLVVCGVLGWASIKVIKIAQHSITMHKTPSYILYSDPASLNRWGFLYVQFKASCYFWIIPLLAYVLVKGLFIALAQGSGTVQSIALVLIEAVYLVAVSFMRPWMDRKVNIFNISIAAINFINAVFVMIFSGVFKGPAIVEGVVGVVFFVVNAIFSLTLLILVLVASIYALVSKNPDVRYAPMRDDRASFIKSQTAVPANNELDALGATARGETKPGMTRDLDDDSDSISASSGNYSAAGVPLPPSQAPSQYANSTHYAPSGYAPSATDPVSPMRQNFPTPGPYGQQSQHGAYGGDSLHASNGGNNGRVSPNAGAQYPDLRPSSRGQQGGYGGGQQQQGANRWQVGAGYDH